MNEEDMNDLLEKHKRELFINNMGEGCWSQRLDIKEEAKIILKEFSQENSQKVFVFILSELKDFMRPYHLFLEDIELSIEYFPE